MYGIDSIEIIIINGFGENAFINLYTGDRTGESLKRAVRKEYDKLPENVERYSYAVAFSHDNEYGRVGIECLTGELCTYPEFNESSV